MAWAASSKGDIWSWFFIIINSEFTNQINIYFLYCHFYNVVPNLTDNLSICSVIEKGWVHFNKCEK